MSVMSKGRAKYPHMEWDGTAFVPKHPKPSPYIKVSATLMEAAHTKLGVKWTGSRKDAFTQRYAMALADSGCQTCNGGTDFLNDISCPIEYLIPTSHRINGITATGLSIIGSVFVRFNVNGKVSRQMVHISDNISGLFLSESALEELGLLPKGFPLPGSPGQCSSAHLSVSKDACCTDEGADTCLKRGVTPKRP